MALFSGAFPDINIPNSQKNEEWHRDYAAAILNEAVDGRYDLGYRLMQESYDFYDGTQDNDEYSFLQESESGDNLPAIWINYNSVRTKVDVLLGELSAKGFEVNVRAINKDAVSRKLEEKYKMKAKMMMQGDLQHLQDVSGMPVAPVENLPSTDEELNDYIEFKYKEDCEKVMEAALKYLVKKYEWMRKRVEVFRDLVITGRCFVKTEIVNGMVQYKRVDPRYMIFDTSSRDDLLRDSAYFGHLEYMPLAEAKQRWKLTKEELENIHGGTSNETNSFLSVFNSDTSTINSDTSLELVSGDANNQKVLVFFAQFQDTMTMKRKVSTDKFGNKHYKKVKDTAKGKDIKSTQVKTWRKATLIGGHVVKDWGLKENMIRSIDDIYDTRSDYVGLVHNFVNGRTVSKVDLIKGLQKFKNMSLYNMQLAMNRAGTKGFFYDISQIPDKWNVEDVLYYLKTAGISFYNSMKDGYQRPNPGVNQFDMTISQSINQYISVSQMIDQQMDEITGVNEARQGQVAAASQAVGVTQAAITSSQFVTQPLYDAFESFSEDMFNRLAGLCKIVFKEDKEIFGPIIGDAGVDFLKKDVDMHMNDYGAFIDVTPPLIQDENKFEGYLQAALQTSQITIADALEFINEKDVKYKIRKLQRVIERREQERMQHEQQMQAQAAEQQAMAQQQAIQAEQQGIMQAEEAKAMRRQQEIDQTHQNRLRESITKERMRALD